MATDTSEAVGQLCTETLSRLKALADPGRVAGMVHVGINPENTLGVSMPDIRMVGKSLHNHDLALALWETGIHEARILAAIVDQPVKVTPEQMDCWTASLDSWDVCDQACINLFVHTPYAVEKARLWAESELEFVKRAGFALMATLAVHGKKIDDTVFNEFLGIIERNGSDKRNYVKKAVNWALRQIGKRNAALYPYAVEVSQRMALSSDPTTRWIGSDALKELQSPCSSVRLRFGI